MSLGPISQPKPTAPPSAESTSSTSTDAPSRAEYMAQFNEALNSSDRMRSEEMLNSVRSARLEEMSSSSGEQQEQARSKTKMRAKMVYEQHKMVMKLLPETDNSTGSVGIKKPRTNNI